MLQVDLLKDQVEEVEEQAALVLKELRAKSHDYELLKRDHAESSRAVQLLQQALTELGDPGPGSDNPKFKFRHPSTRNELASYYLHFMGPKPFYKTYSYV